jgi:hypothetical protein
MGTGNGISNGTERTKESALELEAVGSDEHLE